MQSIIHFYTFTIIENKLKLKQFGYFYKREVIFLDKSIFSLHLFLFCFLIFIGYMTFFTLEKECHPVMAILMIGIYLADCFVLHIVDKLTTE